MLTFTLSIWLSASLTTCLLHIGAAILIDGRVRLGIWKKLGLTVLTTLGPLGTLLELWLLTMVLRDIPCMHGTTPAGPLCAHGFLACNGCHTPETQG
ncbi:MAG: hypothetical protein RQ754_15890 [Desulfuromonadales bacterium]|nr:hypothetical protein [Desulfuromonadales bacterium]